MTTEKDVTKEIDKDILYDFAKKLRNYKELGTRQTISIFNNLSTYENITITDLKETKIGNIINSINKQECTDSDDKQLKAAALSFFNKCKGSENAKPSGSSKEKNGSDTEKKKTQKLPKLSSQISQESNQSVPEMEEEKKEKSIAKKPTNGATLSHTHTLDIIIDGEELQELPRLYPDFRNKTLQLYKEALLIDFVDGNKKEKDARANAIVTEIEKELNKKHTNNEKDYKDEVRELKKFLGEKNNPELRRSLLCNEFAAKDFVYADRKTLLSKMDREKLVAHDNHILESKRSDWIGKMVGEGMYQCRKCKSKRTHTTQQQTRSADEPMTTFVVCVDCKSTWKF